MFNYVSEDEEYITVGCSNCGNERRIKSERVDKKKIINKIYTLERGFKCIHCESIHDTITDINPYKYCKPIAPTKSLQQVYKEWGDEMMGDLNELNGKTRDGQQCCPKCGSTFLQIDKQGFGYGKAAIGGLLLGTLGLLAGGIGSKKVALKCGNCGKSWTP